jgi:hypothetical protein
MQVGDIVFVRGKSPLSLLIRFFDGEFSHVGLVMPNNKILQSQYFTNVDIIPMKYNDYEIIDLGLTDNQRDKIVRLGKELVGSHYDYGAFLWEAVQAIFNFKGKNIWNHPDWFMCSEVLTYLLSHIGWFENPEQIKYLMDKTPNQLYSIIKHQLNN